MKIEINKEILNFWANIVDKIFYYKPLQKHSDVNEIIQLSDGTPTKILFKNGTSLYYVDGSSYDESEMLKLIKLKLFL